MVCTEVLTGEVDRTLLVCETRVLASIATNKIPGIHVIVCQDAHCAHQGVQRDDVNVMGIGVCLAVDRLCAFLATTVCIDEYFRRSAGEQREFERSAGRASAD